MFYVHIGRGRINNDVTEKICRVDLRYQRPKERPQSRWKDDVENNGRKMRIVNWREEKQDRGGWRRATTGVIPKNVPGW
jgi:hypothetical protein